MKLFSLITLALMSSSAFAADVTITLNGGKKMAPNCEAEVQAIRTDGVIQLYLNGGKYCNQGIVSLNGKPLGSKTLPRVFGSIAGDSIALPEVDGKNDYVIDFRGNGRTDRIRLSVNKAPTMGPKIDVKVNLTDADYADLPKCGGSVQATQDVLGDVTVTFSGIDSCQYGTLLLKNGIAPNPAVNFSLNGSNGGSSVRTIGRETLRAGTNKVIYKLWSKPTSEGVVLREHIEVTINAK